MRTISKHNLYDIHKFSPKRVTCLELSVSEICNYKCRYCTFLRGSRSNKPLMDSTYALSVAKKYVEYTNNATNSMIYFGTGEPMLNWSSISTVTDYVRSQSENTKLNFMTNGSLLRPNHIDYIKKNKMSVGLSIDGDTVIQKRVRPPVSEAIDSHGVVLQALKAAKKIDYNFHSLSATYDRPGFYGDALFVIKLCEDYGISEFALDYDILSLSHDEMPRIISELVEVYLVAKGKRLSVFGYWMIPYNNELSLSFPKAFCGNAIGKGVCVSSDGLIKVCGYDSHSFGKFVDFYLLQDNDTYVEYLKKHSMLYRECLSCEISSLCMGQCLIRSTSHTEWSRNCEFYRAAYLALKKENAVLWQRKECDL